MARGTLSGLIWGSVIAVGGAAVLSVSTPMPAPPTVASVDPASTAPVVAPTAPAAPQQVTTETEATSPASPSAPAADSLTAMESADTAPADAPDVGEAAPLAQTADPGNDAPEVTTPTETAPAPVVGTIAPQAPQVSEGLTISTEPAQPTAPAVDSESSGFGTSDAPEVAEVTEDAEPTAPVAEVTEESAPETEDVVETPAPTEEPATDTATGETTPVTETAESSTDNAATQTPAPASDAAEPESADTGEETAPAAPRIAALPRVSGGMTDEVEPETDTGAADAPVEEASTPSAQIGQRAGSLTQRDTAVNALPRVRTAADPASGTSAGLQSRPDPDQLPIMRFAAPFDNLDDKPLLSIVLIDAPGSIGAEALANFPYPLTFAVAPDDPEAADKMARHRAAGFEVLAMMDLPLDATAQDAETALEVGLAALPEIVGVMEGVDSGVQGNRALSDQVTAVLRDQGYGFVTQNSGLNTVQKLAAREGVPAAFVFRDFDGAGQTPTVMRRFLDQAAFRASQEGGVIMMGRVQPDTISALLLWGLQDRATRVALAPVSAVLTMQPSNP